LIAAYLAIMQTRLGAPLRTIAMPPELASAAPVGQLMTLVENAIKYGSNR
jgi:sensor histidine kinase YesM